jgi:hypothetical protein
MSCCCNCALRSENCHSGCGAYREYERERAEIRRRRNIEGDYLAVAARKLPRKRKKVDR